MSSSEKAREIAEIAPYYSQERRQQLRDAIAAALVEAREEGFADHALIWLEVDAEECIELSIRIDERRRVGEEVGRWLRGVARDIRAENFGPDVITNGIRDAVAKSLEALADSKDLRRICGMEGEDSD